MQAFRTAAPARAEHAGRVRLIDDPGQLAEIPRPVVAEQDGGCRLSEPAPLAAASCIGSFQEVLCQQGQLFEAFAERAEADHQGG